MLGLPSDSSPLPSMHWVGVLTGARCTVDAEAIVVGSVVDATRNAQAVTTMNAATIIKQDKRLIYILLSAGIYCPMLIGVERFPNLGYSRRPRECW